MNIIRLLLKASIATLLLTASCAAVAGNIQADDVFLLKNLASGQYLSAPDRGETLVATGNTGAWEQWQYEALRGGGSRLVSYHGTTLVFDRYRPDVQPVVGAFYAGSGTTASSDLVFLSMVQASQKMEGLESYDHPVAIGSWWGPGTAVVLQQQERGFGFGNANQNTQIPLSAQWSLIKVQSPAPGRSAVRVAVTRGYYNLLSAHNTFVTGGANRTEVNALHNAQNRDAWEVRSPQRSDAPLRYGDSVTFGKRSGSDLVQLAAGSNGQSAVIRPPATGNNGDPPTLWTLVDPFGMFAPGIRVGAGVPVCLRSSKGTYLSADPSKPELFLSPNCNGGATWEQWRLVSSGS